MAGLIALSSNCFVTKTEDVLTNLEVGVAELTRGMEGNLQSIESLKGRCDELTAAEDQAPTPRAGCPGDQWTDCPDYTGIG